MPITKDQSIVQINTDDVVYTPLQSQSGTENQVGDKQFQDQYDSDGQVEQPKIAYSTSRLTALWYGSVHVLPILTTTALLVLNFKSCYWTDLGAPNQNLILNALQYTAKAHELLMVSSLTAIVLRRVQLLLTSTTGVPLGFITAGYRLSEVGYIFSKEFWASLLTPRYSNRLDWALFGVLVSSAVALTALVGPSSAVVMIPQLDWWQIADPFPNSAETCYLNMSESSIWPQVPPTPTSFGTADQYSFNYGYRYVRDWVSSNMEDDLSPNITVNAGDGGFRYLSTTSLGTGSNSSLFAASTISQRQATDLVSFWQFIKARRNIIGPQEVSFPLIQPRFSDQAMTMKKPLVQVECTQANLTTPPTSVAFPHYELFSQNMENEFGNVSWPVPDAFLTWEKFRQTLYDPELAGLDNFSDYLSNTSLNLNATFVDVSGYANGPSAAALFYILDEWGNAQIVPCSILAYWSPASIWISPNSDAIVHESSSNASATFQDSSFRDKEKFTRITLPMAWTDRLNAALDSKEVDYSTTTNVTTLTAIIAHWRSITGTWGGGHKLVYIRPMAQHTAMALSMYIAEGLARVNFIRETSVVLHQPKQNASDFLMNYLDSPNDGNLVAEYPDFVQYGAGNVTKFGFDFQRYGYAWSFRSLTTRLAAAVLIIQALLAVGDFVLLLWTGWTSRGWKSPGEMMALALRRDGSSSLRNAGVGIRKLRTWTALVYARAAKSDPSLAQLNIEEAALAESGMLLIPGKKYQ